MTIEFKTVALFGACVFAGNVLALAAQADESAQGLSAAGYQMAAVSNRARGSSVLGGDYDQAIDDLGGQSRRHFASSTNLCVAYTMTGDLEKADVECGAALKLSEKASVRRDIAVALSNLGVIKAVRGDISGAQQDFNEALKIHGELRQASDNLQHLSEASASGA
jgi:tetratricopeptide (TPR) repeat protein